MTINTINLNTYQNNMPSTLVQFVAANAVSTFAVLYAGTEQEDDFSV
jgi:hypothetical protein